MIPHEYVQEVVRRNDIADVVGQYVQLRRRGRTCTGLCPFHNEKTPSFVFTPKRRAFTALAAAPAGTSLPSCARSPTWAMWRRSSSWPPAPAHAPAGGGGPGKPPPQPPAGDQPLRRPLFFRAAQRPHAGGGRRPRLLAAEARPVRRGHPPVRAGLCAGQLYRASALPQAPRIFRAGAGGVRPGQAQRQGQPVRYLPPPGHGAPSSTCGATSSPLAAACWTTPSPSTSTAPKTMVYKKSRTLFALNVAKKSPSKRYILCEGYMTSSACTRPL